LKSFIKPYWHGLRLAALIAIVACCSASAQPSAAQSADYEFYKTRVQPIFEKKRPGHARCLACHARGINTGFVLEPLPPGVATWTEEQTRKNFESASRLVTPGDPSTSHLLLHPLAATAGGDQYHQGGMQFETRDDPDWQTLAAWVKQKEKAEYSNLKILHGPELMATMKSFNDALKVNCVYCHTPPDFASDSKPTKVTARKMLQMTANIGKEVGAGRVTCFTCHRGDEIPKTTQPRRTEE
jgi:nitrate reductase cytochrome c-type subunit